MINHYWEEVVKKWIYGLLEYLCLFPLIFMIGIFSMESQLFVLITVLPVMFLIGICLRVFIKNSKKWVYVLFNLFSSAIVAYLLIDGIIATSIFFLFAIFMVIRGINYVENSWETVFPVSYLWISLLSYFIIFFFFRNSEILQPYSDYITWTGLLTVVFTLFVSNSRQLKSATLTEKKNGLINKTMTWHNRIFIGLTVIFIIIIANYRYVQEIIDQLKEAIRNILIWFVQLFENEPPENITSIEPAEIVPPDFMEEPGDPSIIAVILERIFSVILIILLVAGSIILLYIFFKKIRGWLRALRIWLGKMLNLFNSEKEEDLLAYVDEKESAFDWKQFRHGYEERLKDWFTETFKREPKWKDLKSNAERARFLYRHYILKQMKKGYKFRESNTPMETMKELDKKDERNTMLATTYAKARYSKEQIEKEKVDELKTYLDNEK
ncbi:hypothetical protein ACERII_07115 [Evansella sp. AB-rgal1]|uniref:hypothetical protein n=1 Tax=Evansella sp. AB-rgal1 TaxID=3242696 RepID=UPI00359E58CD